MWLESHGHRSHLDRLTCQSTSEEREEQRKGEQGHCKMPQLQLLLSCFHILLLHQVLGSMFREVPILYRPSMEKNTRSLANQLQESMYCCCFSKSCHCKLIFKDKLSHQKRLISGFMEMLQYVFKMMMIYIFIPFYRLHVYRDWRAKL